VNLAAFLAAVRRRRLHVLAVAVAVLFYGGLAGVAIESAFESGGGDGVAGSGFLQAGDDGSTGADDDLLGDGAGEDGGDPSSVGGATGGGRGTTGAGGAAGGGGRTSGGGSSGGGGGGAGGTIKIGIHDDNPGAAFGQFGVQGGPSSDQGPWVRKVVDWINANGGMGGRKVEIVHHVTASLNGTFDQQAEQACTQFTEDNDVVAVVGGARVPTLNLVDCLARHDTPLVWNYQFMADKATLDKYRDHLYMPSMVNADRLGVWMDTMANDGFFAGGTIGLVRYDNPIHEYVTEKVIKPRLAARGLAVKEEAAFRGAQAAASAADLSAQANNAVLRFQASGVNRVILVPTSAVLPLLFFAAAEAQGFRPKYTMTSFDVPDFQTANAPGSQLSGAKAFGWTPAGDVAWEQQPKPLPPAAQRCVDITAGTDPPGNGSARRFCDGLMLLKTIFDRGAPPTTAGIRAGIEGLGTSYQSAWTFSTSFGPGRHDGATVGRVVAYDDGCECFKYTGGDIAIP
jgi:ABC-type branched-subunit amino acid transport system substrate-binding protein